MLIMEMFHQNLKDVDLMICNIMDVQSLELSPVAEKIKLMATYKGLGAGCDPIKKTRSPNTRY